MRMTKLFGPEESERITFRCSKGELAQYERCAAQAQTFNGRGFTLSRWIRIMLNSAVTAAIVAAEKKAAKANVGQSAGEMSDKPAEKKKGAGRGKKQ